MIGEHARFRETNRIASDHTTLSGRRSANGSGIRALPGRRDHSLEILDAADEAAAKGAKLIVFPERSTQNGSLRTPKLPPRLRRPRDGWFVRDLGAKAAQHGVYIAAGLTELDADTGRLFNSTVIVGPDGKVASLYRKHFLIGYDKRWATPGDNGFPVVQTPLGNMAACVGADGVFRRSSAVRRPTERRH